MTGLWRKQDDPEGYDEESAQARREEELEEELLLEERRYFNVSRSLSASLLFALPLLGIYEVGVLLLHSEVNAAAVLIKSPISWLQRGPTELLGRNVILLLNAAIMAAALVAIWRLRRLGALHGGTFLGMLLESCAYALLLGPVALFPLTGKFEFGGFSPHFENWFLGLVTSSGAGFYEELLFRFVILGAIFALVKSFVGLRPVTAGAVGLLLSGAMFSAAHFLSPGESPDLGIFLYRLGAGMALGTIFLVRGFGIAAWTHALYDVYVICFAVS